MELKLCPFCGGEAEHESIKSWNPEKEEYVRLWHRVICTKCRVGTKSFYTEAEAIEAWNRRSERTAKVIWLEMRGSNNIVWKCAECGQYMHRSNWARKVNYCSHCGAKLD